MSGHSKWHSIKHKKGLADAKKGKIFTKHAKLITIAAQSGADISINSALRAAIDSAKADNMPNTNIERAIKKGTGEDKDAAQIVEVMYEGYGPCGTAILVQALTDNKNRTVAAIKHTFSKNGGNMAEAGAVSWMFERKGVIMVDISGKDHEEMELMAIDAGADDVSLDGDTLEVYTDPTQLAEVKNKISEAGLAVQSANLTYLPKNTVKIENKADAEKVLKLIEALEDEEDAGDVYANFDIPESIMLEL